MCAPCTPRFPFSGAWTSLFPHARSKPGPSMLPLGSYTGGTQAPGWVLWTVSPLCSPPNSLPERLQSGLSSQQQWLNPKTVNQSQNHHTVLTLVPSPPERK